MGCQLHLWSLLPDLSFEECAADPRSLPGWSGRRVYPKPAGGCFDAGWPCALVEDAGLSSPRRTPDSCPTVRLFAAPMGPDKGVPRVSRRTGRNPLGIKANYCIASAGYDRRRCRQLQPSPVARRAELPKGFRGIGRQSRTPTRFHQDARSASAQSRSDENQIILSSVAGRGCRRGPPWKKPVPDVRPECRDCYVAIPVSRVSSGTYRMTSSGR